MTPTPRDRPAGDRPRLEPHERYRMRRLTDTEMANLCDLARDDRRGPAQALEALWDLILRDAEGVGVAEAAARPEKFRVQDYAMAADQAQTLYDAMTAGRSRREEADIGFLWVDQSPCDYDPDEVDGATDQ